MTQPNCENCTLSGSKVPGEGHKKPSVVFVGEAPGAIEDIKGRPFVGPSGKMLRQLCEYYNLKEVYFTNVCLCRPPENRNPSNEELEACKPRLFQEIQELAPKYVVALGAVPTKVLFPDVTLKSGRGRFLESKLGIEGMITYHPAAALHRGGEGLYNFLEADINKLRRKVHGITGPKELFNPETDTVIIDNEEGMRELLERLSSLEDGMLVALDWETTGIRPWRDVGFSLGISWKPGTGISVTADLVREFAGELSKELERFDLTGFNCAMFDYQFNKVLGLPRFTHDAMLMHYMLDERPQQRSLENLSVQELDAPPYESEMLASYDCKKADMITTIPSEVIHEYCAKDVDWSLRLTLLFKSLLEDYDKLMWVYTNLMIPGAHVLGEIAQTGFWVDPVKLSEVTEEYENKCSELGTALQSITDNPEFNPRSHQQVQKYLWDTLKLKQPVIYGRQERSADALTLERLSENYPQQEFVKTLREYRTVYTIYSRYLRGVEQHVGSDGRVRTNIHMDRTETGRLSTTDPALHQIPRESSIRSIYSARPGHVLVQGDYEQVEIRAAAMVAKDKMLTNLLTSGADFHSLIAAHVFDVDIDEVTKEQRQAAKSVSFGLLYMMSDEGLMASTGLPRKQARAVVTRHKGLMPEVQKLITKTKSQVKTQFYVESVFGRRRRFPVITERNLSGLQREAVNFVLGQSPASDITLNSTILVYERLKQKWPEAKIVLTVHDSIIVECPEPLGEAIAGEMKSIMEDNLPIQTEVPFTVEIKIGYRWGEGENI